jgi:FlaG/FlaF family flagellin (archaellin)
MVAITVILSAVIGAFVLEIGDQQETAPTASFTYDQEVRYYADGTGDTNLTTVMVTHAGGDTLGVSQLNIKVNGNKSVWGPSGEEDSFGTDIYRPQPDHFEAATTNTPVTVESGDTWTITAYHGWSDKFVTSQDVEGPYRGQYFEGSASFPTGCAASGERGAFENPSVNLADDFGSGPPFVDICTDRLNGGDEFRAVWRASSGGKTQTLTKYTVQEDGAPGPNPT